MLQKAKKDEKVEVKKVPNKVLRRIKRTQAEKAAKEEAEGSKMDEE
jgi:hypothetical protein